MGAVEVNRGVERSLISYGDYVPTDLPLSTASNQINVLMKSLMKTMTSAQRWRLNAELSDYSGRVANKYRQPGWPKFNPPSLDGDELGSKAGQAGGR